MDNKFKEIKADISDLKAGQQTLQIYVDNLTKIVKDFQDEHIIFRRQLEILRA